MENISSNLCFKSDSKVQDIDKSTHFVFKDQKMSIYAI